jgi:hypothetical protein
VADWILILDSDTVVANLDNSMDRFLDGPHHIMLTLRPNLEIISGAVGVRTTDFGRCFLQRWVNLMISQELMNRNRNMDNGALLLTVAELLDPELAKQCNKAPNRYGNYFIFMSCWEALYSKFVQLANRVDLPIRVYPPLGGFWRSHSRNDIRPQVVEKPCHDILSMAQMLHSR